MTYGQIGCEISLSLAEMFLFLPTVSTLVRRAHLSYSERIEPTEGGESFKQTGSANLKQTVLHAGKDLSAELYAL